MRRMSAASFTVQTTTLMPRDFASAIFCASTNPAFGDQIAPPAALTIRGTEPAWAAGSMPAVHGVGLPSTGASVRGEVRQTVAISGASRCTTCSVRQSNDWMAVRPVMPARRISSMSLRAKGSGGIVCEGSSGETLVSMLKRTASLPARFTSAKSSARRGMRVPSTGFCSGNAAAYFVPALRRPTS